MENNGLISVIVPIYNAEKYLQRCVDSILTQEYQSVELILSDDGSTDRSGKMCDEYAMRYRQVKVIHDMNGGVSKARNRALDVAKGEYLVFVDADDVLANDKVFSNCMKLVMEHHPDVLFWDCDEFADGEEIPVVSEINPQNAKWVDQKEEVENYITKVALWRFLLSREVTEGKRFEEDVVLGEDTLFLTQVLLDAKNLIDTNGIGYLRRLCAESLVHSKYKPGQAEKMYELQNVLKQVLGNKKSRVHIFEALALNQYTVLIQKLRKSQDKKLIRELKKHIWQMFPCFLLNRWIHSSTKVLVVFFALTPGLYNVVYDTVHKKGV